METKKREKRKYTTTIPERASFWSFGVGQLFYYQIMGTYMTAYLMMQGISLAKIAVVLFLVKVWDAVNDPLFGYLFDRIKFKKNEKSLPWLRLAAIVMPIFTIAVFSIPTGMTETGKLIWFGITYVLWDFSYTICDVPFFSMVTTMTNDLDERNVLLSVARVFHGAGVLMSTTIVGLLIGEGVGMSTSAAIVIACVIAVFTTIPLCIIGKEKNYHPVEKEQEETFTVRQMFSALFKNKYLLIFYTGYIIMWSLGTGGAVGLFVCYYLFGSVTLNVLITWLGMIPGPVLGLIIPFVLRKVDKFKLYRMCYFVMVTLDIITFLVGYENFTFFAISRIIYAIPSCAVGIICFMFTMDCAEYGQYKNGTDAKGITFAIQTFSAKIPNALSGSLALLLLGLFSWTSVEAGSFAELEAMGVAQSPEALRGLWIVFLLVPAIGNIIGLIIHSFYKLNDKDVQIMSKCNAGEITREEAEAQLSRKY